jgi:hypothetical protein
MGQPIDQESLQSVLLPLEEIEAMANQTIQPETHNMLTEENTLAS